MPSHQFNVQTGNIWWDFRSNCYFLLAKCLSPQTKYIEDIKYRISWYQVNTRLNDSRLVDRSYTKYYENTEETLQFVLQDKVMDCNELKIAKGGRDYTFFFGKSHLRMFSLLFECSKFGKISFLYFTEPNIIISKSIAFSTCLALLIYLYVLPANKNTVFLFYTNTLTNTKLNILTRVSLINNIEYMCLKYNLI